MFLKNSYIPAGQQKQGYMETVLEREGVRLDQWHLASSAFPEVQESSRLQSLQFLGGVAIKGEQDALPLPETVNPNTLLADVQLATLGDEKAKSNIRTNAATDVAERLFKAGHQTKVAMQISGGVLQQNNRRMLDVNRNTLEQTRLISEMVVRTRQETENLHMFQNLHQAGVLEDFHAVVFSTASTTMSKAEKEEYNFFTDTETCSIQMLSAEGEAAMLETALVAGKATPASERHDLQAIQKLARDWGIELSLTDGNEALKHIFLIPKSFAQGVEDIVALYDQAIGGTFYGQAKPKQDYKAYADYCKQQNESFNEIVEAITAQLLLEAPALKTPLDAILRLDALSERHCVRRAVQDDAINETVFGQKAALDIQEARFFLQIGDFGRAQMALQKAQKNAVSGSCPLSKRKKIDDINELSDEAEAGIEDSKDGKDSWDWKQGVCRVERCSTRPYNTEVGPCDVCRKCQAAFDRGGDPTKGPTPQPVTQNLQLKQVMSFSAGNNKNNERVVTPVGATRET